MRFDSHEEREAYAAGAQDAYDRVPCGENDLPPIPYSHRKPWLREAYRLGYLHELDGQGPY